MNTRFKSPVATNYSEVLEQIEKIDPVRYGKTRNFTNGAVTWLSPYISRGFIDTEMILQSLIQKGYPYYSCEKFIQQLFWREYFQRVWQAKMEGIDSDLKNPQREVCHHSIPIGIQQGKTGIEAIDNSIHTWLETGMMHNHLRMYVAFLTCNLGRSHWHYPAQWMYYHLLDGDWASNALSWQWVAGTFSNKKYIANQENINRYTGSSQTGTAIDISYEELELLDVPDELKVTDHQPLTTNLPSCETLNIDSRLPTLVYNYYNLSPTWRSELKANRIFLLEPDVFKRYPISSTCLSFALDLSKNIDGMQIFVGSYTELKAKLPNDSIYFREHPLNKHYQGIEDPRAWLVPEFTEANGSFFSFWKKNEKKLRERF